MNKLKKNIEQEYHNLLPVNYALEQKKYVVNHISSKTNLLSKENFWILLSIILGIAIYYITNHFQLKFRWQLPKINTQYLAKSFGILVLSWIVIKDMIFDEKKARN